MTASRTTAADRRARYGLAACVSVREACLLIGGDVDEVRRWLYRNGLVREGPTGPRVWLADVHDAMPQTIAEVPARATVAERATYTPRKL